MVLKHITFAIFLLLVCIIPDSSNATLWQKYGGVLRVPLSSSELVLDPSRDMSYEELALFFATTDCLFVIDGDGNVLPNLASSLEIDESGKRYLVQLDQRARFHDGTPVLANDAIHSFDINLKRIGKRAYVYKNVEKINQIGDFGIEFLLKEPDFDFPRKLAYPFWAIVKGDIQKKVSGRVSLAHFIGSGAFKISDITNGIIRLTRNDNYHRGRPYLDSVQFSVMPNDEDSFIEFLMGKLDIHQVSYSRYADLRSRPEVFLFEKESFDTVILDFGYYPWRTKLIRGLDPEGLLRVTMNNAGSEISGIFPEDEKRAVPLNLYKSGVPPSRSVILGYPGDTQLLESIAKSIVTRWSAQGIKTKIMNTGGKPCPECDVKLRIVKSLGEDGETMWDTLRGDLGSPDTLAQTSDIFTTPEQAEQTTFISDGRLYPVVRLRIVWALSNRINDFKLVATCVPDFWSINLQ